MASNFDSHRPRRIGHMTVGELIDLLISQDLKAPVVFRCPDTGAFGPGMMFCFDSVEEVLMPTKINHLPGGLVEDDEGNEVMLEPEVEILPEWKGVVIG